MSDRAIDTVDFMEHVKTVFDMGNGTTPFSDWFQSVSSK